MRGYVFGGGYGSNSTIAVQIQNHPMEVVSLDVEGDDPDWVSSATTPLDTLLIRRESGVVKVLRNPWIQGAMSLAVWIAFIPPIEVLLRHWSLDSLFAIPLAIVPVALVSAGYRNVTKPLSMSGTEPSFLGEIAKAAILPAVAAVVSFLLTLVANRLTHPRP
jgi:hypothetical protein